MGMLSRMSTIVKSKMNRILDSAENPNETLDFAYEKQLEMLRGVKRGVVDMVAAKRRIQQQASTVQANVERLGEQAGQALNAGREDLARLALQRKQAAMIAFAVKLARTPEAVNAADHESLRDHGFSDDDIWDIGAITGLFAMSNRLAHLASMRPNDEFFTMGRG